MNGFNQSLWRVGKIKQRMRILDLFYVDELVERVIQLQAVRDIKTQKGLNFIKLYFFTV